VKGPSIAVMLGGGHSLAPKSKGSSYDSEEEKDETDLGLSETKARAEDAASAFADAVEAKDAARIVKAFGALATLCEHLEELEESGEAEEETEEPSDGSDEE
jgi:hypothetical protein